MNDYTERQVQNQISRILWGQWDPIGVQGDPNAWGEYDAYVGGVYDLLVRGAPDDEVIEHLRRLETETMGLPGSSKAHLAAIAAALRGVTFRPAPAP